MPGKKSKVVEQGNNWAQAVALMCRWEADEGHMDDLLETNDPGRLRWLIMDVFRHWLAINRVLESHLKKWPRPKVRQLLRLALAECGARPAEAHPKVVHHIVEIARSIGLSKSERGFINGVLRSCLRDNVADLPGQPAASFPDWMLVRWQERFGLEATEKLLQWNQSAGTIHLQAAECPDYGEATEWPGYFRIKPSRFHEALPDLEGGQAYIQDPFARIPVALLAPQPGERILDLCAAPGGKTRLIAAAMRGEGSLMAVDRPGKRLERLRSNIGLLPDGWVTILGKPIEDLVTGDIGGLADGVLLDVPCSNTGVMQKRPDVKLRLSEKIIKEQAANQLTLLGHAAALVREGGRLVYSTCSLETEENEEVVARFLEKFPDWQLEKSLLSHPWECRHDGGGAFLLTR